MFGIKSTYPLEKIACNSCDNPQVIRLMRHRICFNQLVLMIWLLIPVVFIYKRNNNLLLLLYLSITVFTVLSVIQLYRILKFWKREKEEWYLYCLSCKHMGQASAKEVMEACK
ncbi:hypothetical protein SAMN04487944_10878 [Gracilibacillus ureilyticus]|uniref:Uncharacterized protein n=1 Tax=Gracilibacillus ureilyticus TaxID=531814 RepID=A0A1H9RBA5_9BACI|nr:hypothetical protein [Gracilibacillus ureilyticus]SER69339.1 hypothetical protein SAMN04487944_10878 [Gracilibacillus ureilyticus]